MDWAARYGHLETLKWLHQNGKTCTTDAMDYAAMNGNLETLIWLHKMVKIAPIEQWTGLQNIVI
jgi:ankyrin repeat protein